jgi:acyl-CoA thioesterase FadM
VGFGAALALSNVGRKGCITLAALLTAAHSVDAEHFIRMVLVELSHRWKRRRGSSLPDVLEPHRVVHICWPTDLDANAHMNNSKYTRLLNYSRRAFWLQNGMWAACARRSPPANMVVTASALRFRRQIGCFERFLVVTRLLHWDDVAFYLEHRFESITDGFVRLAHSISAAHSCVYVRACVCLLYLSPPSPSRHRFDGWFQAYSLGSRQTHVLMHPVDQLLIA